VRRPSYPLRCVRKQTIRTPSEDRRCVTAPAIGGYRLARVLQNAQETMQGGSNQDAVTWLGDNLSGVSPHSIQTATVMRTRLLDVALAGRAFESQYLVWIWRASASPSLRKAVLPLGGTLLAFVCGTRCPPHPRRASVDLRSAVIFWLPSSMGKPRPSRECRRCV
jgi:hypothetical protein